MNTVRTFGIIVLATALCWGSVAASSESYDVTWDSPSADANGSMPLGNGDIGLNAWIEPGGAVVFYISKTDSWGDNGRLLKVGRVHVAFDPPIPTVSSG